MAACLTSPERCAVKDEQIEKEWIVNLIYVYFENKLKLLFKQKEHAIKIDEIHTSIVLALQKHLRKTQAKTRSIFAKGFLITTFKNQICPFFWFTLWNIKDIQSGKGVKNKLTLTPYLKQFIFDTL